MDLRSAEVTRESQGQVAKGTNARLNRRFEVLPVNNEISGEGKISKRTDALQMKRGMSRGLFRYDITVKHQTNTY